MGLIRNRIRKMKTPHTYVILTCILLIVVLMTYMIPAGEYDRIRDAVTGRMIVVPGSFHYVEAARPGIFGIFLAVEQGYVRAADILFLIIFAYSYVYMLLENGALNCGIRILVKKLGKHTRLIIPAGMVFFGLLGSTLGVFEEVYGLIPVFAGIMTGLGYDALVGGSIVYLGVATGFAAAMTNPFSVGIAQGIAEVPINSGIAYRAVIFVVFISVSTIYVMHYAEKVLADPQKSVLYGMDQSELIQPKRFEEDERPQKRQVLNLVLFLVTLTVLLHGTMRLGWYINEIAALFFMMMVISGIVSGYSATKICHVFIDATKSVISSILVVGFTRGILIVMQDAKISDTVVYGLTSLLGSLHPVIAANWLLFLQNIINFFITGSSSQATITMPIMAPVADLLGLNRQTVVLAYCFGDGFSDIFWPTACALDCALMKVPLNKWYKFVAPLFGIMILLQMLFISVSVLIY